MERLNSANLAPAGGNPGGAQQPDRAKLYPAAQAALRQSAFENQGTMSPLQLKKLGTRLVDLLCEPGEAAQDWSAFIGVGVGVAAILRAGLAVQAQLGETGGQPQLEQRLVGLIRAISQAELQAVRDQQEKLRSAVSSALAEQRAESSRLETLLEEVSTPIAPVYDGILVMPLVGAIDSRRSAAITEQLLAQVSQARASCVIVDITGVPVVDTGVAQHLLQTIGAARLLGAAVVLVGISPEIAQTMVQLGIDLRGLPTLSDLQAGVSYALRLRGLHIAPLARRYACLPRAPSRMPPGGSRLGALRVQWRLAPLLVDRMSGCAIIC
ncbi:MAG TPA: STAS domain-containing protein [Herpetosiphonaceae bacterium]